MLKLKYGSVQGCYAEGWAEFTMELAVMVVRGMNGEVRAYRELFATSPHCTHDLRIWGFLW